MATSKVDPETGVFSISHDVIRSWPEGEGNCKALYPILNGIEYDIPGLEADRRIALPECPIILDIGANAGAFSVWAAYRFPGSTVFAYEPNPSVFANLESNAEGLDIRCTKAAVSNADGKAPLYMGLHFVGEASLVNRGEQDMTRAGIVKLIHARHLPEADILKIDTEGSEKTILEHYPHIDKVKAVMLEYHSREDREWIRSFLLSRGFTLVQDSERDYHGFGIQKFVRFRPVHLFCAILSGGGKICVDNMTCMHRLIEMGPRQGIQVSVSNNGGTGVDRARNRSVELALSDSTVTDFMFIDDDIVFEPQWIIDMVHSGLDVTAGAYPRKQISWKMLAEAVRAGVPDEELPEHSSDWIINYAVGADGTIGGLYDVGPNKRSFMEVEEAGTGFLCMKREVLEKMLRAYGDEMSYITDYEPRGAVHHMMFACQRDPAGVVEGAKRALLVAADQFAKDSATTTTGDLVRFAYAYHDALKAAAEDPSKWGRYLTEDYAWCRLWRKLGGKIHLMLDAKLKHIGSHTYEGAAEHFFRRAPSPVNDTAKESASLERRDTGK